MNAVRWHTPPRDLAALVTDAATNRFDARLYHFGPADRKLDCELFLLAPGDYEYTLTESNGKTISGGRFVIDSKNRKLPVTLPKHIECRLQIHGTGQAQPARQ
jgi:hypothetical protein